ncbi:hypothetical protein P7C70_g2654, partial [Phenoliferia sp. Uapishka_3]
MGVQDVRIVGGGVVQAPRRGSKSASPSKSDDGSPEPLQPLLQAISSTMAPATTGIPVTSLPQQNHSHIPQHNPYNPTLTGPPNLLQVLTPIDIHQDLELQPHAGHSDQLISFFESLDSMPDPDVHPDPTPAIWDSFNFAPPENQSRPQEEERRNSNATNWGGAHTEVGSGHPAPSVKHCQKPEHASGGCDCTGPSPLYAALNEEFFRSLPNPVREIVKMRTGDVAASHDLTRAASMAMVLLYRARTHPGGGAEAQSLLIKQSDHYFQQAVVHLEKASIPLEAQLVAVADMLLHQFDQAGGAGTYAILLVGEFFVREALGTNPRLDVASISDASRISLWAFAYADVLRTVCLPRRKCLFDFAGLPGSPRSEATKSLSDQNFSHFGLPVGLLVCFAAISNLSCDSTTMSPEMVRSKALSIEEAIRDWRPALPDIGSLLDSSAYVDATTTQEMWRQACLIYLYQSVYHVGCLNLVIQSALRQILRLGARQIVQPADDVSGSVYARSVRGCPWFLAASVAILPDDREHCRQALEACGPQRAYRDNLEAAERIWEVTDTAGWAVDWKDLMEKEGRFVAFL